MGYAILVNAKFDLLLFNLQISCFYYWVGLIWVATKIYELKVSTNFHNSFFQIFTRQSLSSEYVDRIYNEIVNEWVYLVKFSNENDRFFLKQNFYPNKVLNITLLNV